MGSAWIFLQLSVFKAPSCILECLKPCGSWWQAELFTHEPALSQSFTMHSASSSRLYLFTFELLDKKNLQLSSLPLLSQPLVIKLLLCLLMAISANIKLLLISIYATSAVTLGRIGSGSTCRASKQTAGREVGRCHAEMFAPQWLLGILNIYIGSCLSQRCMEAIFHQLIKDISVLLKTVTMYEPSKGKSSPSEFNIESDGSFTDMAKP